MRSTKRGVSKESRLIQAIYDFVGGLYAAARLMGVSPQLALIWKKQGRVPLRRTKQMAEALGVSPLGLNFEELVDISGTDISWNEMLGKYKFEKRVFKELSE